MCCPLKAFLRNLLSHLCKAGQSSIYSQHETHVQPHEYTVELSWVQYAVHQYLCINQPANAQNRYTTALARQRNVVRQGATASLCKIDTNLKMMVHKIGASAMTVKAQHYMHATTMRAAFPVCQTGILSVSGCCQS